MMHIRLKLLLICFAGMFVNYAMSQDSAAAALNWSQLPPIPDNDGFAGSYAGVSNGALLVAGGSNFPDHGAPWKGSVKVWYDKVFALESAGGKWKEVGKLPAASGYGVSLTWKNGLVCIGGSNASTIFSTAYIIRYLKEGITIEHLPSLPVPSANATGALIGDVIYIAGGISKLAGNATEHVFWSLDLSVANSKRSWKALPAWPGKSAMLAVAGARDGNFYIFGGTHLIRSKQDGSVQREYLKDAYKYRPGKGWSRLADMPVPVAAAPAPAYANGPSQLLIFGGDNGTLFDQNGLLKEKHPGFSNNILAFNTATNFWSFTGKVFTNKKSDAEPNPGASTWAPVTTPLVVWNGNAIIPGGEVRPATRTNRVLMASQPRKLWLPAVISDGMVLQQNADVQLWGKSKAGAKLLILTSWNHKQYTVVPEADGSWRTHIQTPKAGGPYQINLMSDNEKITLNDILIGEVWICSGQSNMAMPVKGFPNQPVLGSNDLLVEAENPAIRLFRLTTSFSGRPLNDCKATAWQPADAQSVKDFSAVGYQYAKLLQQQLNVPVGIIMSTVGGTKIEAWMSARSLKEFPQIAVKDDSAKISKGDPAVLFNAMIYPLIGYGIKGVIWYQGEGNRKNYQIYTRQMEVMVNDWRALWNTGDWPFYYVQIAPYAYTEKEGQNLIPYLREAQQKAMAVIRNSGMAVSIDVGIENSIHPPDKLPISKRLAYWALANAYGKEGIAFQSPVYSTMKYTDSSILVKFSNAANGLSSFGKYLSAFEIAGDDKIFHKAEATITSEGVTVYSNSVKQPRAVRYAFSDWMVGTLYNTEGLPVAPFRTDNW